MARDIIVHPDPKRDARASALVSQVQSWPKHILKVQWGAFDAGTLFRRAPSCTTPGTCYLVNEVACECHDYQQAGNVCKHVRAVRMEAEAAREAVGYRPLDRLNALLNAHNVSAF
jgi:mRNA-degrading endonuclease toxin of MazEF toxin-antitoxin module